MSNETVKKKNKDNINFTFKPNKIAGQIKPMPHKEMIPSTMIDDKLKQKLSSWKDKIFQPTTGKRKGFDLDTLLTPPQHPFLSPNLSNLSLNKTKKSKDDDECEKD
jgi:hypothetical protein